MYEIPIKYSLATLGAIASGSASVLTEHTLVPLGIMVGCTLMLTTAAWKVSAEITKAVGRLSSIENRVTNVEADIQNIKEQVK